jgi:hypothetical protein
LENDKALTSKFIDKVTYILDDVYKTNRIVIRNPPYLLARQAFVPSVIGVEITF